MASPTRRAALLLGLLLVTVGPALTAAPATAATPAVRLTKADADRTVSVKAGSTFTVTLSAIPGAGYTWFTLDAGGPWTIVSRRTVSTSKPGMVGGPADQTFTFRAGKAGQGAWLRFFLLRPFEQAVAPESLWQVKISVV